MRQLKRSKNAGLPRLNEGLKGKKITMPGMSVNIGEAMRKYVAGTLEEQGKAYYEKEGMPIPDFHKMNKIQKLETLNEYRDVLMKGKDKISNLKQKYDDIEQQQKHAKVAQKAEHQKGAGAADKGTPPGGAS